MLESKISSYKFKKIEQKPTSVFTKRNFLSINCITGNKPKKLKALPQTPSSNIIPHYALPKNNQKITNNKTQNNSKPKIKPKKKLNSNNDNNSNNRKAFTPFKLRNNKFDKSPNSSIKTNSNAKRLNENRAESPFLNKTAHLNIYAKNRDLSDANTEYNNNHSIRNEDKNGGSDKEVSTSAIINNPIRNQTVNGSQYDYDGTGFRNDDNDNGFTSNIPEELQLIISEMQKKIGEQSKLIAIRNNEIENLKNNLNSTKEELNNYIADNQKYKTEIEKYKFLISDYKKNLQEKNEKDIFNREMTSKLQEELKNLKENIQNLSEKYQTELNNNEALKQKYNFLKNSISSPNENKEKYEEIINKQIINITNLENELNKFKINQKKLNEKRYKYKKTECLYFELLGKIKNINDNINNNKDNEHEDNNDNINNDIDNDNKNNNNNNKDKSNNKTKSEDFVIEKTVTELSIANTRVNTINNNDNNNDINSKNNDINNNNIIANNKKQKKLLLLDKHYNKIQLILNALFLNFEIDESNLDSIVKPFELDTTKKFGEIVENLSNKICEILNIKNQKFINHFVHDFLVKRNENPTKTINDLFKFNQTNSISPELKKYFYEKCKVFDFKKKNAVPFYYFEHLYKELCFKKNIKQNPNQFFDILHLSLKKNNQVNNSILSVFYDNLKINVKRNSLRNSTNNNNKNNDLFEDFKEKAKNLKNPEIIGNFLDKLITEAMQKYQERCDENIMARSAGHDGFNMLSFEEKKELLHGNKSSSEGKDEFDFS